MVKRCVRRRRSVAPCVMNGLLELKQMVDFGQPIKAVPNNYFPKSKSVNEATALTGKSNMRLLTDC